MQILIGLITYIPNFYSSSNACILNYIGWYEIGFSVIRSIITLEGDCPTMIVGGIADNVSKSIIDNVPDPLVRFVNDSPAYKVL